MLKKITVIGMLLAGLGCAQASLKPLSFNKLINASAMPTYTCGTAYLQGQKQQWCTCFKKYSLDLCKVEGGGDFCEDPAAMREMIVELGGGDAVCEMVSIGDLTQDQCETVVNGYLQNCPE